MKKLILLLILSFLIGYSIFFAINVEKPKVLILPTNSKNCIANNTFKTMVDYIRNHGKISIVYVGDKLTDNEWYIEFSNKYTGDKPKIEYDTTNTDICDGVKKVYDHIHVVYDNNVTRG